MRLLEYGYEGELRDAKAVSPHAEANRVEFRRGGLTEWYVNGPFGLEQGFTFPRAPGRQNGPLTLTFFLSGNLTGALDPGARSLTLKKRGAAVLRYEGLLVRDANGRELKSWMEVAENRLRLRINDARARYPVTVDPLVQSATLTVSEEQASDFGTSTAISSDGGAIVIGAPHTIFSDPPAPGAAYVFLKPATGWATTSTVAAKLVPSTSQMDDGFGYSVSITGDGSTIAVGAPGLPSGGSAYVFIEPSGGWTSSSTLQETNAINGPNGFGSPLQLSDDGTILAVGSHLATVNSNAEQGEVEVFATTDGWQSFGSSQLTASDGTAMDHLGFSVGISGDGSTIVTSGTTLNSATFPATASAYVFVRPSGGWVTQMEAAKLTASAFVFFTSLSLTGDGTTLVIGSPDDVPLSNGSAAYVFVKPASGWASTSNFDAELTPSVRDINFGATVSITRDGTNTFVRGDSAYVFAKPANGWTNSTETVKVTDGGPTASSLSATDVTNHIMPFRSPFLTIVTGEISFFINGTTTVPPLARVFTGYALSSNAVASVSNLAYSVAAGTSSTQDVTLTNSGTAPLGITGVATTGPFSSTQNCVAASPLPPSSSCTETVTFSAGGVGSFSGVLTFTDDAGETDGATQTVTLSGTGIQATTSTTITSASPNPALVGQAVAFSFSVSPPSGDTLTPSGTVTVNASTGESCTGSAPSGSCSITFSTAITRTVTATYAGDTNFTSSPSVSLSEQIVDFTITVSPRSETISPGHLATYTLTVTSANGFVGVVSLSCGPQPPHSTCTVSPSSLSLSGSTATAQVTIDLENKGTYNFTFTGSDGTLVHTATATLTVK